MVRTSALILASTTEAAVQMPRWFGDDMVLQTNAEYGARSFLYGLARPGERVTVTGAGSYSVVADSNQEWVVQLNPASQQGKLLNITVQGEDGDAITARNVQFGDVFFCSGQSNMVFPMEVITNATEEIATLSQFPNFRFFLTGRDHRRDPQWDLSESPMSCDAIDGQCNKWMLPDERYLHKFSAMCYLTARDIARMHTGDRPMGLIQSAWGGTRVEAWMAKEAIARAKYADKIPAGTGPNEASVLYNAMVHPWRQFSVRAVLWNQGEANAGDGSQVGDVERADYYADMYQTMIADWRDKKGMGDFSWVTQSLPPSVLHNHTREEQLKTGQMEIRLAQAEAATHVGGLTDISGTAVAIDLGGNSSWGGIHPPNKGEMSRRMALQALHAAYALQGRIPAGDGTDSLWTGPVLDSIVRDEQGVLVKFQEFSAHGLSLRDVKAKNVDGSSNDCALCCAQSPPFEVSADGQQWTMVAETDTVIQNSSVLLRGDAAKKATSVRYAFLNYVECVLQNNDTLPAGPFRKSVIEATVKSPLDSAAHVQNEPLSRPPMGFNSWNFYHCNIDENSVKAVVDAIVQNGMKDVGFEYVNIDDCWQVERFPNGTIQPDPSRFPSGMKALADYAHSKGLKFGVYTARGSRTCQNRHGAYQHEEIDAATYCEWGLDYLKNDNCGGTNWPAENTSWIKFTKGFEECFNKTGRYIVRSVEYCEDPKGCGEWISQTANLWRTTPDIQATWESTMANIHSNDKMASVAKPGHYNDPDLLQVGDVGLSSTEQYSHFSLWCVAGAPLLVATDIVHASNETLKMLTNPEPIAINQDLGFQNAVQGRLLHSEGGLELWSKRLADGLSHGIVLLNLNDKSANITVNWSDLSGLAATASVRDLWARKDLGVHQDRFTTEVPSHGVAFIKATSTSLMV